MIVVITAGSGGARDVVDKVDAITVRETGERTLVTLHYGVATAGEIDLADYRVELLPRAISPEVSP